MKVLRLLLIFTVSLPIFAQNELSRSERINRAFNELNKDTINELDSFYHEKAVFNDPLEKIVGRPALKEYYASLYQSVESISFDITDEVIQGNNHFITWTMKMRTPKVKNGKEVVLEGASLIKFETETNLVIYHRDYFDMGAFIYEHLPFVGGLIRFIKDQLRP